MLKRSQPEGSAWSAEQCMTETPLSSDRAGSRWISTLPSRQASRAQQSWRNQLFYERFARRTDWAMVEYDFEEPVVPVVPRAPECSLWTRRHSPWQLGDDAHLVHRFHAVFAESVVCR